MQSPELQVGPAEINGAVHPDYASWTISMTCAEPDGCAGELALEIRYRGGGEDGRVVLLNVVDLGSGAEIVFDGLEEPPRPIVEIDRLTLEVRSRERPGSEYEIEL